MIIYTAGSVVFQKVLDSKYVFSVSVSSIHPIHSEFEALSVDVELEVEVPPDCCSAVLCSSTVCVYET